MLLELENIVIYHWLCIIYIIFKGKVQSRNGMVMNHKRKASNSQY